MFGNAQSMSSGVAIIVPTLRFEFYGADATSPAYKGADMTTIITGTGREFSELGR
jgi:hypothetical protein